MKVEKVGERIATARKKAGLTQKGLAEKLGVTAQAVSKWENGRNLPDIENLMQIAETVNVPYSSLLIEKGSMGNSTFTIRDRLFHEENMFTRVKAFSLSENLTETYRALQYMRERHEGQFRKQGKFTAAQVKYINHPLLMACQARALGVRDDALLAAILLHDVVEDTGVSSAQLPFSDEVREIVELVTFSVPEGLSKQQAKETYYAKIQGNGKACLLKVIDRCNNVSTMAGSFSREKLAAYIEETETFILPLLKVLKEQYPQYSDMVFLVKYQILSVLETVKCLTIER